MRTAILLLMVLAIASTAMAQDLGSPFKETAKNKPTITYTPPDDVKVGGDTIETATVIPGIPYSDSGNTMYFMNDYDEVCPNTGSTSPDVVYSWTPGADIIISVDLCGSGYDTKTYIYDDALNVIACDDDFYGDGDPCGSWTSKIEGVPLSGGMTYYIVIDGWGGEFGPYELSITDFSECLIACHPDAVPEGEPPLEDDMEDTYNAGCNADPPILQPINWANNEAGEAWLCGRSGDFLYFGNNFRDTDWFSAIALGNEMTFTVQSAYALQVAKLTLPECPYEIELFEITSCGVPVTFTFPTTPGEEIWLATAALNLYGPVGEFEYFATLSGHVWDPPVANEEMSWGGVKALFR